MSVPFYDWLGRYKMVDFCGYSCLVGPNAEFHATADWWVKQTGKRPDIRGTYEVSHEFYEKWQETYAAKGYLFDGEEGGNEL